MSSKRKKKNNDESSCKHELPFQTKIRSVRKPVWKNDEQKTANSIIKEKDVTFLTGPPGTGKTFIAIATAIDMIANGPFRDLIIMRPLFTLEKIGIMPGDLNDKMKNFVAHMQYMIQDLVGGKGNMAKMEDNGSLQIMSLAYLQGMTFNEKQIVVLDEAQNATADQLYIFLTRMASGSKIILTGDINQDFGRKRAFEKWIRYVKEDEYVGKLNMTDDAIVRHPIVRKMTEIYRKKFKV